MTDRHDADSDLPARPPIVEQPREAPPRDFVPRYTDEPAAAAYPPEVDHELEDADELEIDDDDEPTQLVVIRTYNYDLEAQMARLELEASGIPAVLFAGGGNALPYLQFSGGVRLAVPDWAVEDADLLLRPLEEDEGDDGEPADGDEG